jgi:hypothetical protein
MHVLWLRCSIRKRKAPLDVTAPHIANDEPKAFSHSGHFVSSHNGRPRIGGGGLFINRPKYANPYLVESMVVYNN